MGISKWLPRQMVACALFSAALLFAALRSGQAQTSLSAVAPVVSLTVNQSSAPTVFQGWPLIFEAAVYNPDFMDQTKGVNSTLLSMPSGSWASGLQLLVADANGNQQSWPIHVVPLPSGSVSLGAGVQVMLAWWVAPSDSSSIPPGNYQAVAILDASSATAPGAFNAVAMSAPVPINLSAPPSTLSNPQIEEQGLLTVGYDLLLNNTTQALSDVNNLLSQLPGDIAALATKADLQRVTGDSSDALSTYEQAVDAIYSANPNPPEPPSLLLKQAALLRSAKLLGSSPVEAPQMSLAVSDQGMQSPGILFLDLSLTNNGTGPAEFSYLNQFSFATLKGTGQIAYDSTSSPSIPIATDALLAGGSTSIRIYLDVPSTVTQFTVHLSGTSLDLYGNPYIFSATQTISPNSNGGGGIPLTIIASNATQLYGQATPPLNNATYSGFVNGDTPASLSGSLNCTTSASPSSPVGSYPITCSGLSSLNYVITFVPGTFTVTTAPLTITAGNATQQYGKLSPSFNGATYIGFVNGDTSASLSGSLSCTTSATQSSAVGTYLITCSGVTSTNYSITFVPGVLLIGPAPLTITANNASRQYGQANPPLNNVTYSGFVNGDTSSTLAGTLNCISPATQTSPGGTYTISCSGLTSANYTITFVPGTLIVTRVVVTITANNATKVLNSVNPTFTWTASGFVNGDTASALTANPSCTTTAGTNSLVGSYSITCSGASAVNYTFVHVPGILKIQYATGIGHVILPPINADGTSVWKQGRTIPAKFAVYDANGVSIGTPGVVSNFFLTGIQSGTSTSTVEDVVDTNNPDTAFRWDPTSQQWIFTITTGNMSAGSTYIYTITLNDGTTIMFQYGLR